MMVYRLAMLLLLGCLVLVGCRSDDENNGDDIFNQSATEVIPQDVQTVEGCQTEDLEQWLEVVLPNAQALRDESLNYTTLTPETVLPSVYRLTDLSNQLKTIQAPECVAPLQAQLQLIFDEIVATFVAYQGGRVDQATLIQTVTAAHARYDTEVRPQLDEAFRVLDERYKSQ